MMKIKSTNMATLNVKSRKGIGKSGLIHVLNLSLLNK